MLYQDRSIAGYSLVLNVLFVCLSFTGYGLLYVSQNGWFDEIRTLTVVCGLLLAVIGAIGAFLFKGRLMHATVGRLILGSFLIFQSLAMIAHQQAGSQIILEHFQDDVFAYRVKELIGWTSFSLEGFSAYSSGLYLFAIVLYFTGGVLLVIGGKVRWMWVILGIALCMQFLARWEDVICEENRHFTDLNVYEKTDTTAQRLVQQDKLRKDIKVVEKTDNAYLIEELKAVRCPIYESPVSMKMKAGRAQALNRGEQFQMHLLEFILIFWVLVSWRSLSPNTVKQNWRMLPWALIILTLLSFLAGSYLYLMIAAIALIGSLWIYRAGGKLLGNHYGSLLFLIGLISAVLIIGF